MKKIMLHLFLIVIILCFTFSSCSNSSEIQLPTKANVRITLTSPVNDKVEAKVYIEGYDGTIVNGAVVSAKDSSHTVTLLYYNTQEGCYYSLLNKPSTGTYTFTVNSILFDAPKVYTIPHTYLENTLDIKSIEMANKIGESYQNYDAFDTSYPIRITWPSTIEGCIYKITIRTPSTVLYETSTNNKTIELPANTIPANTNYVYLQIQQQKIYGDIQFQDENYYSVSVYSTGSISFNVL